MHQFPVAGEIELQRVGQKPAERLGHVAAGRLVVVDVETLENALVEVAVVRVRRVRVVEARVGKQRAQVVNFLEDLVLSG
ncbi:hypothetical protein DEJ00_08410 [Curtobacterium sp. MCLR17_039]|uniref:hypothetical protein n=1 Tax=Curtobacterium sp. MCLR17_039 TaxID=2175624 RepID=UPI000DA6EFCF|nr:hypothetical protein [Curtobacterium sp. MCLR17_039]PZE90770.1 hypothetical protein DEJ00_08410 [Curtobacterium sp. MCLR17_039]